MRKTIFTPGNYYHIYNRGVHKQNVYLNKQDYTRFLFLILFLQSPLSFPQISRHTSKFLKGYGFSVEDNITSEISKKRTVELVSFVLMPNHFHLILREIKEGGISDYMQRVQNGYTKYFNIKYKKSGHLFQGPFGAVEVEDNNQFLYLSSYIHKNPKELNQNILEYPWSSCKDYITENRWPELLKPESILSQFKSSKEYNHFVKTSTAKEGNTLNEDLISPSSY